MKSVNQCRRLDPLEQIFRLWNGYLFAGVEYEKPGYTEKAIQEIIRTNSAFHCKLSLLNLKTSKCEPMIVKIPPGLKSLDDVTKWMYKFHTPKANKLLGSIAYDDTRLVVNTSHICGDGIHHTRLIEHLCNPEERWPDAVLPESSTEFFHDQIFCQKWKQSHPIACGGDTKVTRINPKRNPIDKKHSEFMAEIVRIPIEELSCYNPSTKKCSSITEAQWLANALSTAAFQDQVEPFAISTVYDLRRILTPEHAKNPAVQNYIASVLAEAKPKLNMTLLELGQKMRASFNQNLASQHYFGHMYNVWEAVWRPWRSPNPKGLGMEVSSVGPIKLKPPVKDAWIVLRSPDSYGLQSTSFLSFSLLGPQKKEFAATFQYCSNEMHPLDGKKIAKSIEFCLRNLKDNMTVQEAIDSIKFYQKSLP